MTRIQPARDLQRGAGMHASNGRLVFLSALLALLSFSFMTASALSVDAAMLVGISLGVGSLGFYGWAFVRDANSGKLLGGENETETRGS